MLCDDFGGHTRQEKASVTTLSISTKFYEINEVREKQSKNSRQLQNMINRPEGQIESLSLEMSSTGVYWTANYLSVP